MGIDRKSWFLYLLLSTGWGSLPGCVVTYPVVGGFVNYPEVFRGRLTARSNPEKGSIVMEGQVRQVRCVGRTLISLAPPGKEGQVALDCQDGKRILTIYRVVGWGKGYGSGADQEGRRFIFTFGMQDREAAKYIREGGP